MKPISNNPGSILRPVTARQHVLRCLVFLLLGNTITFVAYRSCIWHAQWAISRLGGQTIIGTHPLLVDLSYNRVSGNIRRLLTSRAGQWLVSQFPAVYSIDLRGITDSASVAEALQIGAGHPHVMELVLFQSAVRDEHLVIVARGFPGLRSLKLNETMISDSGIAHLVDNTALRHLNLQRSAVTNSCIQSLRRMPNLKELNIAETGISSPEQLRQANPDCCLTTQLVTLSNTTDKQHSSPRRTGP